MKRLVIDRHRWARTTKDYYAKNDGRSAPAKLLSEHSGKMCCLGFYATQICGASPGDIRGIGHPVDVRVGDSQLEGPLPDRAIEDLIKLNDRSGGLVRISDKEQERRIKNKFARFGIRCVFKN